MAGKKNSFRGQLQFNCAHDLGHKARVDTCLWLCIKNKDIFIIQKISTEPNVNQNVMCLYINVPLQIKWPKKIVEHLHEYIYYLHFSESYFSQFRKISKLLNILHTLPNDITEIQWWKFVLMQKFSRIWFSIETTNYIIYNSKTSIKSSI